MLVIRPATGVDSDAIWNILGPVIRAGETYCLPRDMTRAEALAYWLSSEHEVFVAEEGSSILGTYFLRANQRGAGSHVANCGYITATESYGRGIASAMCTHSLEYAKTRGFRSMQFNFVVSTNERAIRLWERLGFTIVGRLPEAFRHPVTGYVDAFVMHRFL